MNRTGSLSFFLLFLAIITPAEQSFAENAPSSQLQVIATTARYYLESGRNYQKGDLITESQIDELQQYLRRSFGNSPATHRGLLNRAVKDNAPLSRYFHREHGSQVLRRASEKLGGYAALEVLSLDRQGRQILQKALTTGTETELIAKIESFQQIRSEKPNGIPENGPPHQMKAIYTLEDFLEAASSKTNEKNTPLP